MVAMMKNCVKLKNDRRGVTAMEYGIIAGLLALVIVGGLTVGKPALEGIFDKIGNTLVNANNS